MRRLLPLLLLGCCANFAFSQTIDECPDPDEIVLSSFCGDACVVCDIDGYTGTNDIEALGEAPPGFCAGQLHNTQWVGFVAGSENVTIDLSVFDCEFDQNDDGVNEGLQVGIYNTTDCENYSLVSNCDDQVFDNTTQTFTNTVPLIVGGIYFLVIDGAFGDICSFSVDVTSGSTEAPQVEQVEPTIESELEICPGGTLDAMVDPPIFGAGAYFWTLDGEEVATDLSVEIEFPSELGFYELCVDPYNPCSEGIQGCIMIEVVEPDPIPLEQTICEGEIYTLGDDEFDEEGEYDVFIQVDGDCDLFYELEVFVIEPVEEFLEEEICVYTFFEVGDEEFDETGEYEILLMSEVTGCDSIVYLDLTVVGTFETTILYETICEGETYPIGGDMLVESGSYFYEFTDEFSCDSLVDLTLTVLDAPSSSQEQSICTGESFSFNGTSYNSTGIYSATIPLPSGCDSIATLDLTVVNSVNTTLNEQICAGESFTVGSTNYTTTGQHVTMLTASNDCDSIVTLNLQVIDAILFTDPQSICSDENYTVGANVYNTSGTYDHPYILPNGCDSTYRLVLTVIQPIARTLNPSICEGQSFSVGGQTFNATGNYSVTTSAPSGCDSVYTVNLTVSDVIRTTQDVTVCEGGTYDIDGTTLTMTGMYDFTFPSSSGCDSIATINFVVADPIVTNLTETICSGGSYMVGNQSFNMAGDYTVVLMSSESCDSTVNLTLTVDPVPVSTTNLEICAGSSINFNGTSYNTAGTYSADITTPEGCDSTAQLILTIADVPVSTTTLEICAGSSINFNGTSYNTAGTYSADITTPEGCDSTAQLVLTVAEAPVGMTTAEICEGEVYTFNNVDYNMSGDYTDMLTTPAGCDSIDQLMLTVIPNVTNTITPSICTGTSFVIDGTVLTEADTYTFTFPSSAGCDSIVTVILSVEDAIIVPLDITICEGETYPVGGNNYNMTGMYEDSFVTPEGCDSIVMLDLTVIPTVTTSLTERICLGDTYMVGNESFTMSGIFTTTIPSVVTNCDSVVTLNLTVVDIPVTEVSASICDGGSYQIAGESFSTAGMYTIPLLSVDGCDSTIMLDLVVTDFYETNLVIERCEGETYTVGNSTYSMTGIYQDDFQSQDGCDSIVNLDLTINPLLTTSLTEEICEGESFSIAGIAYNTTGIHQETIASLVTGCDSTIILDLTVYPVESTSLVERICEGENIMVGDSIYTETGSYFNTLETINGCDSVVSLNLTVLPILETFLVEEICDGETFTVGTDDYTTSGDFTSILTSVVTGCDSIVNLDLNVIMLGSSTITTSICEGEEYIIGGVAYTTTGTHQETVPLVGSVCDSVITLNLTVNPVYDLDIVGTICEGESYAVGDSLYTETGSWPTLMNTVNGCDSLVTLDLTVVDILETNLNETICAGDSYMVGTSTYTSTGSYTDVLMANTGCDSIVNLELFVREPIETMLTEAICADDVYEVGAQTFNTTGNYTVVLTSLATACDSTVFLDLTVNELAATELEAQICNGESFLMGGVAYTTTGIYQADLNTSQGCDSTVVLDLYVAPCALTVSTTSLDNECNGEGAGNISFSISVGTPPYAYNWNGASSGQSGSGTIENSNETIVLEDLIADSYTINVVDSNGVTEIISLSVGEPEAMSLSLEVLNYGTFQLSCADATDGSISAIVAGGTPPYSYEWSNGMSDSDAGDLPAGVYDLVVTDANGCSVSESSTLTAPALVLGQLEAVSPDCAEDQNGTLSVAAVAGGTGPYVYAIDGGAYSTSSLFAEVPVGMHTVSVQDANGCSWELEAEIEPAPELTIDLDATITVNYGQETTLSAITSYPVVSYEWSGGAIISCDSCATPVISPEESISYAVTVTDENGCTAQSAIVVYVNKERDVFIPTAFSPDGDAINDIFMIYGGGLVVEVESFFVFNRWGESVYEGYNFQPGMEADGWDGRHRGQVLNTGVYVYVAVIRFADGTTEVFKGDVMLMH